VAVFQQEFENFIEFTFGQWDPNPGFDNILGLGFKSVNTGTARVRGVDFSVMGERTAGHWGIQLLAGYTYTKPVSTSPDLIYGRGSADPSNPFVLDNLASVSYATTSSDPTNNILKYRLEHLVRADVGVSYKKWNTGVSVRYNSHMQNIDSAFETLEDQFPSVFNPGIIRWRREHTTGDTVVDLRLGYRLSTKHRVALVANNVMNRVYAIRPLALEDTRLILLQYSFSL
jgi:outer membrane receptor for ferric coprogen and ferric-rhodotorulic acid